MEILVPVCILIKTPQSAGILILLQPVLSVAEAVKHDIQDATRVALILVMAVAMEVKAGQRLAALSKCQAVVVLADMRGMVAKEENTAVFRVTRTSCQLRVVVAVVADLHRHLVR